MVLEGELRRSCCQVALTPTNHAEMELDPSYSFGETCCCMSWRASRPAAPEVEHRLIFRGLHPGVDKTAGWIVEGRLIRRPDEHPHLDRRNRQVRRRRRRTAAANGGEIASQCSVLYCGQRTIHANPEGPQSPDIRRNATNVPVARAPRVRSWCPSTRVPAAQSLRHVGRRPTTIASAVSEPERLPTITVLIRRA